MYLILQGCIAKYPIVVPEFTLIVFKTHVLEREFSVRGNLRVPLCRAMMVFLVE